MRAQVHSIKNKYDSQMIDIDIIEPKIKTRGAWGIVVKGEYSVVVYDQYGRFKEVVVRTALPRTPLGAWSVWAIKYKGKTYTSLVDSPYPFLEIVEGRYQKKRTSPAPEPSILISDRERY